MASAEISGAAVRVGRGHTHIHIRESLIANRSLQQSPSASSAAVVVWRHGRHTEPAGALVARDRLQLDSPRSHNPWRTAVGLDF